ncbi:hypothetical protein MATR_27350 [Marivirga tractuosa]|uniref:Lipoprotein n=1 Tax=Marivirga tractuosa (strain ATCC 23168 / DSM 4126 / NBRC 15989 / NCIMB 1408 / VKM B-1430 / H-43) TaxID=643867 RepID=E4TMI1_MARTH|nr:hypothetical protein [Marivirga tractuosa]ADR23415.1 hypothetical protein Ftrac_3441 [Marivirga tractuosa DSM 4126]BDD15910.1 hypothetical protein MATR_27350 [Marivirga tractuosa]
MALARMKVLIYIPILIAVLSGCSEPATENQKYQVSVDYEYDMSRINRPSNRLSKNTLYLFFEQIFEQDTIDIYLNTKKTSERKIITTEDMLALADVFEFKNIEAIHSIKIRMNSGPILSINTENNEKNIWRVGFWSDTLRALPLRSPPIYD